VIIRRKTFEMRVALPRTDGPPTEPLRRSFEAQAAEKMRADVERLGFEPEPATFAVEWRGLVGLATMVGLEHREESTER
jgi:hypothetical protein